MITKMNRNRIRRFSIIFTMAILLVLAAGCFAVNAESAPNSTGLVNSSGGAYLRKKASITSGQVTLLKDNAKITILKEHYTSKTSTSATKVWYYVKFKGKKGYIRSDLVDNVTYSEKKGTATADLNYRVGPGVGMEKVGAMNKKSTVHVVQLASVKGDTAFWYKLKMGDNYYYSCADYIKLKSTTTKASEGSATQVEEPEFVITGITTPQTIGQGASFVLKGEITSTMTMEKAIVGVVNNSGTWKLSKETEVNATVFDIATVDKYVKFGLLDSGKYKYKVVVYVGGKEYVVALNDFKVKEVSGPNLLANTAKTLAWPYGTDKATYQSEPTEAYAYALEIAYPDRSSWSAGPKAGKSCDVFIGTVCRYCGYDTEMARGLGGNNSGQWKCFQDTSKWTQVNYSYNESELRNGDIIIYKKTDGSGHVCMYLKIDGKGYLAEAALDNRYGMINDSISKIFKSSDKAKMAVYRAVK